MTTDKAISEYQKNAKIIKEIEAELAAAEKAVWEKIKNDRPEIAGKLILRSQRYCRPKKPKGFAKVIPAFAERLTRKGYPSKTQTEITAELQKQFPNFKIPLSIWQKKLNFWELKEVRKKIDGKPLRFSGGLL